MSNGEKSRVALITGAAGGLGTVMTQALLEDGHRVVAMDTDEAALTALMMLAEGADASDGLFTITGDVAVERDCKRAVAEGMGRFGALDIVVNNAGIGPSFIRPDAERNHPSIMELTPEWWDRFYSINVRGAIQTVRAALPAMQDSGWGRIVNNTTSFRTMLRILPYGSVKAALESLSAVWAAELEGSGIGVHVLVPGGPTDTGFISDDAGWDRDQMLRPDVFAAPIRWIASNDSDGITGQRYVAAHWDTNLPPSQAAEGCAAPIGWPDLGAAAVWPGSA